MIHDLKIKPGYFRDVLGGKKNFEIRKDDRGFREGDTLILREWDGENYTGRWAERMATYVFHGTGEYGLMEGYCVIGLTGRR